MTADYSDQAIERFRNWAINLAFPFWIDRGFDVRNGRFEERLSMKGEPIAGTPIRLIVQARQIYSYSIAARRGWSERGKAYVEQAYASMIRDFYRRDGQDGWAYTIHSNGVVADGRRDLYSHAFVLLAIASYVKLTGKTEALKLADDTLAFIDTRMCAPCSGGYLESIPNTESVRRQNPHMHMFEGLLALWSASAEARYLARAGEMFGLLTSRFFAPASGTLGEYFDDRLNPIPGMAGKTVEPGHHFEWVWLLRWFERESGRSVVLYADALYRHASAHGYDSAGLVVDEIQSDGSRKTPSHRAWPMTEAIKANIAEAQKGRPHAREKALELAALLFDRFLKPAIAGGWIDRLDQDGAPAADFMPASTFYHIVCALDELENLASSSAR